MTVNESNEQALFAPHPVFGRYISHHPSDRFRLLVRGAIIYAVPVIILQLLFWNVESDTAESFLPIVFAAVGLGVFWYVAHLWNREVILYERGFTYQEGSRTGHFRYEDIIRMHHGIERIALLDVFHRTHYAYILVTDQDEILRINNLYSEIDKLIKRLEGFITRDRLPVIQAQIKAGGSVAVGGKLQLTVNGLEYDGRELFWHELTGRRIKQGQLMLLSANEETWATIPVSELDNAILVLAVIKSYTDSPARQVS